VHQSEDGKEYEVERDFLFSPVDYLQKNSLTIPQLFLGILIRECEAF
jgi:hypothetical protein